VIREKVVEFLQRECPACLPPLTPAAAPAEAEAGPDIPPHR
jgi:hypothetical protein